MPGLLLPVPAKRNTSWATHQNRRPKSEEPGTDLFVPIGTPVIAPADGVIWGYGLDIRPATGRWCGANFLNGMSFRGLHMLEVWARSGYVEQGQTLGLSGATGYGEEDWSWNVAETGGAHLHATLWPTWEHRYGYDRNGKPYTIDLMPHIGGVTAASGSKPLTNEQEEDMSFTDQDREDLKAIRAALAAPKPGADYSLIRLADRPEVFLSTNRQTLRWIKDERELELVRYTLRGVGAPAADRDVEVIGDLPAYGLIDGPLPADPIYAQFKA